MNNKLFHCEYKCCMNSLHICKVTQILNSCATVVF